MSGCQQSSKNFNTLIMLRILLFFTTWSCTEIPCLESDLTLNSILVENNGYIWNCGLKVWKAEDSELPQICDLLRLSKEINRVSVRVSHWRLDIYMNDEGKKIIRNNLELFHSENNGYVFRKGDKYFSNDDLAEYLIKSLGITNSDSLPCE